MELNELKAKIAEIIEKSRPSCGDIKECWTQCGECGAEKIIRLIEASDYVLSKSVCRALNVLFWKLFLPHSMSRADYVNYIVSELADKNIKIQWNSKTETFEVPDA